MGVRKVGTNFHLNLLNPLNAFIWYCILPWKADESNLLAVGKSRSKGFWNIDHGSLGFGARFLLANHLRAKMCCWAVNPFPRFHVAAVCSTFCSGLLKTFQQCCTCKLSSTWSSALESAWNTNSLLPIKTDACAGGNAEYNDGHCLSGWQLLNWPSQLPL